MFPKVFPIPPPASCLDILSLFGLSGVPARTRPGRMRELCQGVEPKTNRESGWNVNRHRDKGLGTPDLFPRCNGLNLGQLFATAQTASPLAPCAQPWLGGVMQQFPPPAPLFHGSLSKLHEQGCTGAFPQLRLRLYMSSEAAAAWAVKEATAAARKC